MAESSDSDSRLGMFQCRRCNACCRQPGFVYLKPGEAERLAAFLQLNIYDFTEQHCDLLERRELVLKKRSDEACIFLSGQGCKVHEVKPQQCRNFPVQWRTPRSFDYCEGLKELFP